MGTCNHVETEILNGCWKVGARVVRRRDVFNLHSPVRWQPGKECNCGLRQAIAKCESGTGSE